MAKTQKRSPRVGATMGAAGGPQNAGDTTAAHVERHRIAARAYELYLSRGGSDGQDLDDWLQAERELAQTPPTSRSREH